jgi:HTH-type transcriptional regulator / antitoxin HigA
MMKIKVIETEEEYRRALKEIDQLIHAEPGSPEANQLEVLFVLIEKYEEEHYPIDMPDLITAIKFRMEQQGLLQKDLIPYLGSQSRVSDILNGKRELSKEMIRKLHKGLDIPYEVLMQTPDAEYEEKKYDVEDFPFNEMVHQGYFPNYKNVRGAKRVGERLLDDLFSVFKTEIPAQVFCRHGQKEVNENALFAWQAFVLHAIQDEPLPAYQNKQLNQSFLNQLLDFSAYEKGVLLVKEHLNKIGIHFKIAEHLQKTYLDGASFISPDGAPVVGLTLRYDRIDNFWFTLFHELAHVKLHLSQDPSRAFFDETIRDSRENCDPHEVEANQFAWKKMIPETYWKEKILPELSALSRNDILDFAEELKISPAIIAGRIRYQSGNYTLFSDLIGTGKVRQYFAQVTAAA